MVFVDGLAAYIQAYFSALYAALRSLPPSIRSAEGDPPSVRRLIFLAMFPLFLLIQLCHGLFLALDHLFFPGFRTTRVTAPVFVLGVPRSGTTYLHRELARNSAFTAPRTWELLIAPSLTQRYLIRSLSRLDQSLGAPGTRVLSALLGKSMAGVQDVHPVGLNAAEEDYLALLPAGGCFFASVAFPESERFRNLGDLATIPPAVRRRLLDHYHALLKRQVYFHGGKTLLSKNAAFATWTPYLAERFPDARFIFCIRHPETALSSQLNSLREARRVFGSFPRDDDLETRFRRHYESWWTALAAAGAALQPEPLVIEQEWLRHNGGAALRMIDDYLHEDTPALPGPAQAPEPVTPLGAAAAMPPWSALHSALTTPESAYRSLLARACRERELAA